MDLQALFSQDITDGRLDRVKKCARHR